METLVACLTSPGKGAIATIGVRGDSAWAIVGQLFHPGSGELPREPTVGHRWFGRFGVDHFDDAVLAVKFASATASVEIHCHGGIEIVRLILNLIVERGARLVTWQEFLDDPIRVLLAQAPTGRTAAILLDQIGGAWQRTMMQMEHADPEIWADLLQRLGDLTSLGQHLVTPWKIVLAGAPNVGKSSLMNALAGFTRSIVAPTPGTTRDAVTLQLAIDGWPVEITDTAGLRESPSSLEMQGIERARAALESADLRLWVLDGAAPPIFPDGHETSWQFVINKIDLPAGWDWNRAADSIRVSARTGAGIVELCARISQALAPDPPASGEAVPVTPEHFDWIDANLGAGPSR